MTMASEAHSGHYPEAKMNEAGRTMSRSLTTLAIVNALVFVPVGTQAERIAQLSAREGSVFLTFDVGRGSVSVIRNGQTKLVNLINVSMASGAAWIGDIKEETEPTLSPEAERIALVARRGTSKMDQAIVICSLRDGTATHVVDVPYKVSRLAWSPTGREIAFIAQPERFVTKLYSVDLETRQISEVDPEHRVVSVSWSPDGKEMAVAEPEGSSEKGASFGGLFVFNRETKKRIKIGEGGWPSWSPDGRLIAYLDGEQKTCYVVSPDGGNRRRLFSFKQSRFARLFSWYRLMYPLVWSPDMRYLIYHREAGDAGQQLKVMLLDLKSRKTEVLSSGGQLEVVDWRATKL